MPMYLRKLLAHGGYMDENKGDDGAGGSGGGGGSNDKPGEKPDDKSGGGNTDDKGGNTDDKGSKVSDSEAKLIKEVMDKKTKLKEVETQLGAATAIVKQLEELGGIDAIKALVGEKKASETKKLEEKGEWDRLRAQMADEHKKEVGTIQEQLAATQTANKELLTTIAELTVGNSFASSKFIGEDLTIPVSKVRVLYGQHFEYKDGVVVGYDKPAGAKDRTMLVDGKGDPLDFEAAIKKIVDTDPDREQMLKSKMKPGAGSSTAARTTAPDKKVEQASGVDRIASALAKGVLEKK